jgi:hypothetical protein
MAADSGPLFDEAYIPQPALPLRMMTSICSISDYIAAVSCCVLHSDSTSNAAKLSRTRG